MVSLPSSEQCEESSYPTLHRSYRLVPFYVALRAAAAADEHGCAPAKCSRIAQLQPLHITEAGQQGPYEEERRYVIRPGRHRIDRDKEDRHQRERPDPGRHHVMPNAEIVPMLPPD